LQSFLVLSEGELPLHPESVEGLVLWCYPYSKPSVSIHAFRKAILAPKNYAVNQIHILALSMIQKCHLFLRALTL
jgi:hypothetical protein